MILEIQKEIRQLANPQKAKVLMGFFKTGKGQYAQGDKFLGVMVPQTRILVKKYKELSLKNISELMKSEFHEERLLAVLLLVYQYKNGDDNKKEKIFNLYLKNRKYINNWDLVDLSADHIVGSYLQGKNKNLFFELAKSKLLWDRRIAMLATFYDIKKGDAKIALEIAEKLLDDKHDLMHKAVGWMLREVGKRCSTEIEENFLDKYAATMPRTSLRYAIERFSPEKKRYYMELKNKK
jgi:3-methyladenine DNA glycosylase AlkD